MRRSIVVCLLLAAVAAPLHAQTLKDNFSELFTFGNCGEPLCLDVDPQFHGTHYITRAVASSNNLLGFMNGAIAVSLGQIPFTAANSGTVLTGIENGIPVFRDVSAGPILAERAQTMGKGKILLGGGVNVLSLSTIRGIDISDLRFTFVHQNVQDAALGDPTFERDIIDVSTDLSFDLTAFSFTAAYGLTDRIDVGILVPVVSASLSGESRALITNQFGPATGAHQFASGASSAATTTTSGDATGIGDVGVRLKANLHQGPSVGIGALVDARLPTGDEENFLGTGNAAVRVLAVVSGSRGAWNPHLNAGFAIRSGDVETNGVLASVGFDRELSPNVTFAADVLTDLPIGDSDLTVPEPVSFTSPEVRMLPLTNIPDQSDNLVDIAAGLKFVTQSGFRFVGNVLIPLLDGGARPSTAFTFGIEKIF